MPRPESICFRGAAQYTAQYFAISIFSIGVRDARLGSPPTRFNQRSGRASRQSPPPFIGVRDARLGRPSRHSWAFGTWRLGRARRHSSAFGTRHLDSLLRHTSRTKRHEKIGHVRPIFCLILLYKTYIHLFCKTALLFIGITNRRKHFLRKRRNSAILRSGF